MLSKGFLKILNITNPHDIVPGDRALINFTGDVTTFEADGRTYAAVTLPVDKGIQILDITNPYDMVPADSITDRSNPALYSASDIAIFGAGDYTYAAVTLASDKSVQILDITNPHGIVPADSITDDDNLALNDVYDISTFEADGRTYAAVTSHNSVQMVDITDPHGIIPAGGITDKYHHTFDDINAITAFEADGRTYAAVASHDGVQMVDITDPHEIISAGGITDDYLLLGRDNHLVTFGADGRTYAAVTSGSSVQLLDITDPHEIVPTDSISDDGNLALHGASDIAIFGADGRTYAAVASPGDSGIQLLDITDPHEIVPADSIADDHSIIRDANGIAIFDAGSRTYAAVTSFYGVQLLDITYPDYIIPADGIVFNYRNIWSHIVTFDAGSRTYAAVTSFYGVYLLDVTDPHDIVLADSITDDDNLALHGANDIAIFEADGHTYAAVASSLDDGIQLLDITDPHDIVLADSITDDDNPVLDRVRGITIFEANSHTYAAVTSFHGVQLLDITDPHDIVPADSITDDDGFGGAPPGSGQIGWQQAITDDDNLELRLANDIAIFEADGHTYAAVASYNSVQLLDVTDPHDIVPADSITKDYLILGGANDIVTFETDGHTYAAVASDQDNGVQLIDVTDPYHIVPADSVTDDGNLALYGANDIVTFETDGHTYAAVASYHGIQLLDVTDPYDIVPADYITDDGNLALYGASDIVTFETDGHTYAAVVSPHDNGIQLIDVTDPHDIVPADSISDGHLLLGDANSIVTFDTDGHTYAAVVSPHDNGIQLIDVTDPYDIVPADSISGSNLEIRDVNDIAIFEADGHTYAAVTSPHDNGIQLIDVTDPYDITGDYRLALGGAAHITTFNLGNRTYAAVTSAFDGSIQILDITDPHRIALTDSITRPP